MLLKDLQKKAPIFLSFRFLNDTKDNKDYKNLQEWTWKAEYAQYINKLNGCSTLHIALNNWIKNIS